MHTTLLVTVTLACQAFGAYVDVNLENLHEERSVADPLANATNLLNRHRRSKERDTSKHGVTAAERLIILNEHNSYRRKVKPSASNMHYMVRDRHRDGKGMG
ncbi:hypothetical protein NP493_18g00014 [Ridgeia piscesae]|uniref:SCP domain-containing protein n=1 Tax=Ridgeia piscesae TaxID=27915 RepID=A0AAD9UKL7_RIDPI|nr:hypothetical protein NP493_18g00014 [Ridgeia piscesae]